MNQKCRTFDANFKLQAVQMIKDQGLSISHMNPGETAVCRWLKQVDNELTGGRGKWKLKFANSSRIAIS
jgi:transposase